MSKVNIFVTGATGYIGGTVLARLLEHPKAGDFQFHALVRSLDKAEKLKAIGVNSIIGSLDDLDLIHQWASSSDIVLSMADADHLPSVGAMLSGMKERHQTTGKQPIFIHTSGTGVLADNAAGMYPYDIIWNDADPDQMATLPPTQLHRDVDLAVLEADQAGYVKAYLIIPATIYSIAKSRLVGLGIQNPHSLQIPALIRASLDRKQGGMVGAGKNLWPNVDIEELGDLYVLLFDAVLTKPETGHGLNGYYFGASGEHSLYDVGEAIAGVLVDLGIGQSRGPTTFTKEEIDKYFGGKEYLGSNSRCQANHSLSLGWKPNKSTPDMLASIRPEVEALIKKGGPAKSDRL